MDPPTSIRKHANELKVHEKTVRTAIRKDLSPDLNLLDYTTWGILEKNKQMQLPIKIIIIIKVIIRSKLLSSISICHMQVFTRFSGHGNSIHNIIPLLKKNDNVLTP